MKAEVAYEVAKEKCEDQKGAEQATCKKNAKADKDRAMAAAKGKTVASNSTASHSTGATTGTTSSTGSTTTTGTKK